MILNGGIKMKQSHHVVLYIILIISIVLNFILCVHITLSNVSISATEKNTIDFFRAFLYASKNESDISIDWLVPVEWDTLRVFKAYATKEDKIAYAGYQYADDLGDINYEDEISLIFLRNNKVVYYVDTLLPRLFEYTPQDNGNIEMSIKGGKGYSVEIDASVVPQYDEWAFYPQFDEASNADSPHLKVANVDTAKATITLQLP